MNEQLNKLPAHDGLGDIVLQEPEEETGDIPFYRPCLYRWSKEAQKAYETENDRAIFTWCVRGANPVWGAWAWILKEVKE